jgi:hypothetical protein
MPTSANIQRLLIISSGSFLVMYIYGFDDITNPPKLQSIPLPLLYHKNKVKLPSVGVFSHGWLVEPIGHLRALIFLLFTFVFP